MKDIVTPVPQEEVKAVIRKCLEQAALVNYQRLSEYAKLEGKSLLFCVPCYSAVTCSKPSGAELMKWAYFRWLSVKQANRTLWDSLSKVVCMFYKCEQAR